MLRTCSSVSSSWSSSPGLSAEKRTSASCPAPDNQEKSSHHRMKSFDPARMVEGNNFPWLYKTDLSK